MSTMPESEFPDLPSPVSPSEPEHRSVLGVDLADLADATRWRLLLGLAAVGLLLSAAGVLDALPRADLSLHFGAFLLTYTGLVGANRLVTPHWQPRLDAMLDRWVRNAGSGFYGLVMLSFFACFEAYSMADEIAEFELSRESLRQTAIAWMIGFSMESVMNTVKAAMWPVELMRRHGMPIAGLFVGLAWGLYWLGARVFPDAERRFAVGKTGTKKSNKRKSRPDA